MFFGGVALLAVTVVLAIVFMIWKPVYRPESAAVQVPGDQYAQQMTGSYPVPPVTARQEGPARQVPIQTDQVREETEYLFSDRR